MPTDLHWREFNPLKIWHHADRMRALANGLDIAPVTVELDPTATCNHHCSWCVDPSHRPIIASRDFLWNVLDELAAWRVNGFGVQGIVFKGGGEPTLHPDFADLLEKAHDCGFEAGVVTNGSRLLQPGLTEALDRWASYVRISVDGPTPHTHSRIHGSDDFAGIIAGVEKLVSGRQSRHPIIGLSFAMDYSLLAHIPDAITLGETLKVDYILIRPPFFEEVGRPATMNASQAAELRRAMFQAANDDHGPMNIYVGNWIGDAERQQNTPPITAPSGRRDHRLGADIPIEHRSGVCQASPLLAVIAADGQVYGCCNLRYLDEWSFGRIDYEQGVTLAKVWESTQRQEILDRMHTTACIAHCTHPLTHYNEIIEVLRDSEKPHSSFL